MSRSDGPEKFDNVRVCARFRPIRSDDGVKLSVQYIGTDSVEVATGADELLSHQFIYSHVYDPAAKQDKIYSDIGAPVVKDVLQGYNGTIFGVRTDGKW